MGILPHLHEDIMRELKSSFQEVFIRGNVIRIRLLYKWKFTISYKPTDENLLRAHNLRTQLSSMIDDEKLTIDEINKALINQSFKKGYVSLDFVSEKKSILNDVIAVNLSVKQNTPKTKTIYECLLEKSIEYKNQETVIPYTDDALKSGSIITYENYLNRLKHFYDIKVADLTIQDVENFIRHHMTEQNTYKYVNEMLRPIREILEQHVEFGIINHNILENKALKKFMRRNLRRSTKYAELLTIKEVHKIIQAENCILKFIVIFGLFTGTRVGEAQMMQWSQNTLNIKENRITILSQFTSNIESTPKSKNSIRDIPIVMHSQNENFRDEFPEKVLLDIICHFYSKSRFSNFMFYDPTTKERWRNSDAINYRMKQFLNGLGIYKHITFHDLRHWFTAYAYEKVGLVLASKYLGHSSTKETLDNYMKIKPDIKIDFKEAEKFLVFKKKCP